MMRSLACTVAVSLGLAWFVQAQQQNTPVQNPKPAGNQNPQAQPVQNQPAPPAPNQQAQPGQIRQAQPAPQQAPNTNQPNVNVQGTVQAGTQGTGTMIQGRIVRTGQDQFVVQGIDNRSYTFYTNPQTRYWMNNNPAQYSHLQVGSNVTAWYTPQGERYFVSRVNLLPAGATFPVQESTTTQVQAPPTGTSNTNFYQGEVVRVVGQDQVVIKTSEGKEITIHVHPQTTYKLNDQPATINQFQPGTQIRVDYELRDRRPFARGIFATRRDRR